VEVNPPDDPVAIGLGVLVTERLAKVLDPDLPVPLIDSIKDGRKGPGERVRLLDAHRLAKADDNTDEEVNRVIHKFVRASLQRPLLRPVIIETGSEATRKRF
jgi:hypothetical protein